MEAPSRQGVVTPNIASSLVMKDIWNEKRIVVVDLLGGEFWQALQKGGLGRDILGRPLGGRLSGA